MLERIAVILRVIIKLIRVREEIAAGAEGITAAHVRAGQADTLGLLDEEHVLRIAVQRFAYFVPDIGVCILIGDDLYGVLHACRTMVGRQHERESQLGRATP